MLLLAPALEDGKKELCFLVKGRTSNWSTHASENPLSKGMGGQISNPPSRRHLQLHRPLPALGAARFQHDAGQQPGGGPHGDSSR